MPQTKPGMKSTLLRQWAMLRMIPRLPRKIGTGELMQRLQAADFNVDLRTVQRDLNQLSEVLPLTSDLAKPQGWSWKEAAGQFDIPGMEPQVALVFHMSEMYLRSLLPVSTVDTLKPWFSVARQVLDEHGNGVAHWPDKVRVLPKGLASRAPDIADDVQCSVYQGILQGRRLAIEYGRDPDDTCDYVIDPLALVVRDRIIYLLCLFDGYQDVRQVALQRIRRADQLPDTARRPADFSLDSYIAEGEFGLIFGDQPVRLTACFLPHLEIHLRETPIADDQALEWQEDGRVILTACVPDTLEMRLWLRSFGDEVEVLGPTGLRAEFAEMARELTALYRD